ncbi:hypothetical protein [Deinococcus proteolyticus]|uniref:hypothetical protein n=1 Tax=Deinococcus proteolyticus TaxID=55148 RepID=UPI0011D1F9BE|nr:hypothetical protein [Deinococcus proteolyticus]
MTAPVSALGEFWGNLSGHHVKHTSPSEKPHLEACGRALLGEFRERNADPDLLPPGFLPQHILNQDDYAALGRLILFMSLLPGVGFNFLLDSSRSDYQPYGALNLNIIVPNGFLGKHGESGDREIVLGLHLAIAERVSMGRSDAYVPILSQDVFFSTLYAPDAAQSSRLRGHGRASTVVLL